MSTTDPHINDAGAQQAARKPQKREGNLSDDSGVNFIRTTTRDVRRNRRAAKKAAAERLAGAGGDHSAANRSAASAFMAKKNVAEQAGASARNGSATRGAAGQGAAEQGSAAQDGASGGYGVSANGRGRADVTAGPAGVADGFVGGATAGYQGAGAQTADPNGQVATDGQAQDSGAADSGNIVSISGLAGTPHAQIVGGWRRYHGNDQEDGAYEAPGATPDDANAADTATEVPNHSEPVAVVTEGTAHAAADKAGASAGFGATGAGASTSDTSSATVSAGAGFAAGVTEAGAVGSGASAGFDAASSDAVASDEAAQHRERIAHRRERGHRRNSDEETAAKSTIAGSKSFSPKASITNLGEWLRYQGERFVEFWRRHPKGMVAVVAVVVALVMVYGPARDYYVAWRRQSALQATYDAVSSDNEALQGDVDRLQSREGIEDEARRHGYGYSGESTIDVEGLPDDSANQGSNPIDGEVQAQETDQPWYIRLGDIVFGYTPDSAG
ncbi:MAG: hypothetical protein ACI4B6_01340 [Atopobiaceae bacterium]